MSAHTPGPWVWNKDHDGLEGAGETVLSYAAYEGMWLSFSDGKDANARLIAAAPDLLAACKLALLQMQKARRFLPSHGPFGKDGINEFHHSMSLLVDAVAKAEGTEGSAE